MLINKNFRKMLETVIAVWQNLFFFFSISKQIKGLKMVKKSIT